MSLPPTDAAPTAAPSRPGATQPDPSHGGRGVVPAGSAHVARGMAPADVGELVDVGDPRVSPDGRRVAFVVTAVDLEANEYRSRVWLAAADASVAPRPLTAGECRDASPRWSPDGARLAFTSHRRGEGTELYVLALGGGEATRVAAWPEEIEDLAWSPDGARLAFTARRRDEDRYAKAEARDQPPRRVTRLFYRLDSVGWTVDRPRHLFVVDAPGPDASVGPGRTGGGEPRALTGGPFEDSGIAWSPNGAEVAFASARHDTWDLDLAVDAFALPVAGGEARRLTETGPFHAAPSWSPDGARLAFVAEDEPLSSPRHAHVGVLDLASGARRLVSAALDRNCAPFFTPTPPVWDGDDLYFRVEDAGNVHVYRAPADGSAPPSLVVAGDRQVGGFDLAGGTLAFVATTPTAPPELFVLDRGTGEERRLTGLGRPNASARALAAPQRFVATSPDGAEVEAWAMPPVGAEPGRRYPTLLNVHGGPFAQYGNRFFDEFQLQAGAGYAVLYANPRGSSGYAEAWGRAIRWPEAPDDPGSGWGGVDHEDLVAVLDEAGTRFGFVDPDRLGVLGGSYGGYMTTWMVGHTNRFKAACSERAANDLLALEQHSDFGGAFRTSVGVSHLDDPEAYRRHSPLTYAGAIETPLLILHSEDDLRCPVGQAEALFVALRLLGREVEMLRFPGESHELSRSGSPRHRVQRAEAILEWFDRHLRRAGG